MQTLLDEPGSVAELPEGQERGSLTVERIAGVLAEIDVTKEQVTELHDYLAEQGIAILSPVREVDLTVEPSMDSLRLYLRAIGRVELLTADREVALARRIERGALDAKQAMVEAHLRLVVSIAKG